MAKKKKGRKKRRLKGILAKMGAVILGTAPVVSAVEGAAYAASPQRQDLPIGDKILLFATRSLNNLSAGLIGKDIFPSIELSGQAGRLNVGNAWKDGQDQHMPWLISTATGLGFMAADWIAGKLSKSATKMGGVTITGN
jgi:hypothetical protein